jgi:hypothetical protein
VEGGDGVATTINAPSLTLKETGLPHLQHGRAIRQPATIVDLRRDEEDPLATRKHRFRYIPLLVARAQSQHPGHAALDPVL